MIAYPDTSFLCALYVAQSTSAAAIGHYQRMKEPLHVSALLLGEFRQSVRFQIFRHSRDATQGYARKTGLEAVGLRYVVEASARLPQLNSIYVPEGVDEAAIRARLLSEFNLEIGAGLGDMAGKIWRIGLMGYSAKQQNVDYCLKALKACLN